MIVLEWMPDLNVSKGLVKNLKSSMELKNLVPNMPGHLLGELHVLASLRQYLSGTASLKKLQK